MKLILKIQVYNCSGRIRVQQQKLLWSYFWFTVLSTTDSRKLDCAVPENIHTPPMEGFFFLHSPSPQEIAVHFHTLLLKISF